MNVENLIGGTASDVFNFHQVPGPAPALAKLSGFIAGQAGTDRLDYGLVSMPVSVDLAIGQASGVGGNVGGIENVTGGQGDDILMGDGLANVLKGGGGADIVLGRAGPDELHGDDGRDLLIGGLGADTQFGGADDDLLIAGPTTHDGQPTSLRARLLAEWNQTGETYERRMANLRNGGGLNGGVVLTSTTVSDDLAADELWAASATTGSGRRSPPTRSRTCCNRRMRELRAGTSSVIRGDRPFATEHGPHRPDRAGRGDGAPGTVVIPLFRRPNSCSKRNPR